MKKERSTVSFSSLILLLLIRYGHGLIVIAAPEVLVRLHVDVLLDEPDGAVPEAEVRPARMVRLEAPRHVPVPYAVGRVDAEGCAVGVAAAPGGEAARVRVNRPVDRLDGLALGDSVVAR